ncbi:class III extradiol dioxygenase subunit B-like domain-containing protein [Actinomadura chokoriensis]|uniref:Class III extradiol dioxygenase subunit B-like domain-containing protein n=1 Tax=Actinomadura chokoriensis TaxID=454156 RepID=A0ABV4R6P4_9ACTN
MLVSAAVCPHPPVLVPEMAGEAAPELDALRAACDEAVRRLRGADAVIVVGGGPETRSYGPDAYATLTPFGLDWTSPEGEPTDGAEPLPLSLTIGNWLLERQGPDVAAPRNQAEPRYQAVGFDAEPEACMALGRDLAETADRVALLVMGDGSACRSEKAPGYLDLRARPYDEGVARGLGNADAAALAALDPGLSRDVQAGGRAAWQVLAGAAGDTADLTGELLADEAPYGVGYFAAAWSRTGRS